MLRLIMILTVVFLPLTFGTLSASQNIDGKMKYFTPLTQEEEESINYIISTLSYKSTISLLRYRKQLEVAGSKTTNVHPLRFWKYVLVTQSLRRGLPKMGGIPKRQLIGDFAEAFTVVSRSGWMKQEYIDDFCESTGISKNTFNSYAKQGKWGDFLGFLFKGSSKV
jgi:hypothetical protein